MATLVLQAAGSFVGGAFGPWGAAIGAAAGSLAGNLIDRQLLSGAHATEGPRLEGVSAMTAEEGAPIARVYGTARVSTTIIWATRFEETANRERQGGKAAGGGTTVTTYSYSASFAVGLCHGPINTIRRIWADGKEIDQTEITLRLYRGRSDQSPDPLIVAKQGDGNAPAYRGLAYIVFEDLPLERFGNRVPQIEVEVIRAIGDLEAGLTAISIIPGSTEHGLDPTPVQYVVDGQTVEANRHVSFAGSDWNASIDELFAVAPALKHVSLVVSWFGDDLRAGECHIRPGIVERSGSDETHDWMVTGRTRLDEDVHLVTRVDERAAYGGTPTDASVVAAIRDLKQRGVAVALNPFLLMDVAPDNTLPSPYDEGAVQPAYPWRGRITCSPARNTTGSVDRTNLARQQLLNFVGVTDENSFVVDGEDVAAPSDVQWNYRTFIFHYAHLAVAAGGIDTFIIGSELRGLTEIRDSADAFPFVEALVTLADDVRTIVGPDTKIVYAGDWTEYFGFQPDDGSGDVYFNLDPLWASTSIDAIGIDHYAPLSDWRENTDNDGQSPDGFRHHADRNAMKTQIQGGEGFDWYFTSQADREQRQRTTITDGAYNKPWVFRYKDIENWWSNLHYERRGGVENADPTAWQPKSKPVYLMEVGCTALRGGAIQPNLFPDPKSSENGRPFGTTGALSDAEQRAYLSAHLEFWAEAKAALGNDAPVDPDRIYAWAWDARPYPAFPVSANVWGDSENWHSGHWLNGRLGTAPVSALIEKMLEDHGVENVEVGDIPHSLDGFVILAPGDLRSFLEPITSTFDVLVSDDQETPASIKVDAAQNAASVEIPAGDLLVSPDRPPRSYVTPQKDEVPSSVSVECRDPLHDYKHLVSIVRPKGADGDHPAPLNVPGIMRHRLAVQSAHAWTTRMLSRASSVEFEIPISWVGLQTGDLVTFDDEQNPNRWLVERVDISDRLSISATAYQADGAYSASQHVAAPIQSPFSVGDFGSIPQHLFLDLPANAAGDDQDCFMVAAKRFGSRHPVLFASVDGSDFEFRTELAADAVIGTLTQSLEGGATAVWDNANMIAVDIGEAELSSISELATLAGSSLAAIEKGDDWEILAFSIAEEAQPGQWELSQLLRGLGGTEDLVPITAEPGARFVLLNSAVQPAGAKRTEIGRDIYWRLGEAGRAFTDRYFRTTSATPGLRARLPLSPVHLRAHWNAEGGISASWIRRARRDGDDWAGVEIPLDEQQELYAVQISTATAELEIEVSAPAVSVSATDLLAARIDATDQVQVTVAQVSQAVGSGLPASISLNTS